jgi:hypothetical protein
MKSAIFFGALFSLVIVSQTFVSVAHADGCEVRYEDIGGRDYARIYMGTGPTKRSATMEEVFDAMNVPGSTLFELLKFESGRTDQPLVYVEAPKEPIYYNFKTKPSPALGDGSGCEKQITGYECRVKQLKKRKDTSGLPKGIKTGIAIAVPSGESTLLKSISDSLGCKGLYKEDGTSAIGGGVSPIQIVPPADGAGTKP